MNKILSRLLGKTLDRLEFTTKPAVENLRSLGVLVSGMHKIALARCERLGICFAWFFQNNLTFFSSTSLNEKIQFPYLYSIVALLKRNWNVFESVPLRKLLDFSILKVDYNLKY